MKLSKKTLETLHEQGHINVYDAKKETNKFGTFITIVYAVRFFRDGECTAISTERTCTFEGSTQQDIIKRFC